MYQRSDFYRHARYVHGWLSAFAFIILMFFAATGLFLNNPQWFEGNHEEQITEVGLPPALVEQIQSVENPSDVIINHLREHHSIIGRYQSSEVMDNEVMIRLESPAGQTDIWVMLDDAQAEITRKPASVVTLMNDLHRGKNVAKSWSWLIDISAIIILLLSVAGYILFLTIKTRLITHLVLTAASLLVIIVLIWTAI